MSLTGETPGSEVESLWSGRWFDAYWGLKTFWSLWLAVLSPECFMHPHKGWEIRSRLVSVPLGWPGYLGEEKRWALVWVSGEGMGFGPGVSIWAGWLEQPVWNGLCEAPSAAQLQHETVAKWARRAARQWVPCCSRVHAGRHLRGPAGHPGSPARHPR